MSEKNSGFTIIELTVVIFIVGLISLAIAGLQIDIFSINKTVSDTISTQNEMRQVFKKMTSEIRSSSSSNLGAYPIADLSQNSFTFYNDADGDGLKERIRYFLNGTVLERGVLIPSGSPVVYNLANEKITDVVHNVANGATSVFNYYDKNYDGTTSSLTYPINTSSVTLVKITIIENKMTFTTQVSIRNLKDNL